MQSFVEYYLESLLTEKPHITFTTSDGYEHLFDLRFEEEWTKPDMSFSLKKDILKKKISNIISSMDIEAKQMFWNELQSYPNIDLFLQKVYGIDFAKLYSLF